MIRNQIVSGAAALAVILAPALALAGADAATHQHATSQDSCACSHAKQGMNGMKGMNGMDTTRVAEVATSNDAAAASSETPSAELQNIWSSP